MADEAQQLVISLEARVNQFEKAMAKANGVAYKRARSIETRFEKMNGHLSKIGRSAFAPFIASAAAALAPVAALNKAMDTISDASNLAKAADRAGLATDAFQELQYGFGLAGVAANDFENGMEQFAKRIAEAGVKGGTLADILEANQVALRDQNGEMRSAEDLLRDYADLVKGAASAQERMILATEAFGRGGADFVLALRNGSDGLRDMQKATVEAGGVIDEELLRRAETLDDEFTAMWRRFSINSKSAILTAVTAIDDLISKGEELGNSGFFKRIAEGMASAGLMLDDVTLLDPDLARAAGRDLGPDARIRDAFTGSAGNMLTAADEALIAEMQKRYGTLADKTKKTVLPTKDDGSGSSRNAAVAAANREAEAVLRVIENLEHERALIGATDVEREKANALRQAGTAATAQQRAEIEMLIEAIYREREATEAAAEAAEELRAIGKDVLGGMIQDITRGTSAAEALANALSKVADRLLEAGLNSLFSGSGFGGIGKIFGLAKGGVVANGRPLPTFARGGVSKSAAIFGEAGPEAAVPLPDGRRIPVDLRIPSGGKSGGTQPVAISVSVEGANGDAHVIDLVRQGVQTGLSQYDKQLNRTMGSRVAQAQTRQL